MANVFYRPVMGDMLAPGFRLAPAVVFYVIFVFDWFSSRSSPDFWPVVVQSHSFTGRFGFVAYATYDLTNQATLKNWSWTLTIADMVWGTLLSTASAYVGYCVTSRISG
ncbi:DUF2177 family protein [Ochrobactrum intermedium]|nr:DUF2177 family protein [Brucella intermedia]NKB96756.1 DUF2177 family protein [Brucella intermedia]